jgi:hypothetical protein
MRKTFVAAATALIMVLTATAAWACAPGGHDGKTVRRQLEQVERITKRFADVGKAARAGFTPFAIPEDVGGTLLEIGGAEITCFDSSSGGMGVHYVRHIDDKVNYKDPEALVYSVGSNGRLRLVAVEYIIPEEFVDPANPPMLLGQHMHHHSYLPVYILHAWVHKSNPDGVFADFNPRVGACPSA